MCRYLWENLSSSAPSSCCIPVFFLFRYMGGRQTCLRCVFMTRHEYGADSSSEAAANDGMELGTASASLPGPDDTSAGGSGAVVVETSPDIFTCFWSSSACSRFAILFRKTGRAKKGDFRFEEGSTVVKNISLCCRLLARRWNDS